MQIRWENEPKDAQFFEPRHFSLDEYRPYDRCPRVTFYFIHRLRAHPYVRLLKSKLRNLFNAEPKKLSQKLDRVRKLDEYRCSRVQVDTFRSVRSIGAEAFRTPTVKINGNFNSTIFDSSVLRQSVSSETRFVKFEGGVRSSRQSLL